MASLIEAIDIKRKMFFEYENAPYHCIDVDVSKPTARGGQTLVRVKMRNLLTRAVFDKTFKAGEKFSEPDLVHGSGDLPLRRRRRLSLHGSGDLRDADAQRRRCSATIASCSSTTSSCRSRSTTAPRSACSSRRTSSSPSPHTEPGVRGDTASGSVTKLATLETGLEIRVPLFIKEGEKVKVHTETREFAGRA